MSNDVFPALRGMDIKVARKIIAPPVFKRRTPSRREYRARDATLPEYLYSVSWNALSAGADAELQTLVGFFNKHGGDFDSFLFEDPDDNAVTDQVFGVGNGVTTLFPLVRTFGGFVEPIPAAKGSPAIYLDDWQGKTRVWSYARTNLITNSQNMASWSTGGGTVTSDTGSFTAPDGTYTADILIEDSTNTGHVSSKTVASQGFPAGSTLTFSRWVKRVTGSRHARFDFQSTGSHGFRVVVNLDTGAFLSQGYGTGAFLGASVTAYADGWYRVTVTGTVDPAATSATCSTYLMNTYALVTAIYTGDGTSSIALWGGQVEVSNVPTRYIPTTTATVTLTDYTLGDGADIVFSEPPATGTDLLWTGGFYWRVRFERGELDVERFLRQLYEGKRTELRTVQA